MMVDRAVSKLSRVDDVCLLESLKCLSRDDIDQFPMVGRRFHRALSHPYFQSAPLRVLNQCYCRWNGFISVEGSAMLMKQSPRFFDQTDTHWGLDVVFFPPEGHKKLTTLSNESPWLRFEGTRLEIVTSSDVEQLASARLLWENRQLEIVAREVDDNPPVDITPLLDGCDSLSVSTPRLQYPCYSMEEWDLNSCRVPNCLTLSDHLYGLTPERLIHDFLIPGGPTAEERQLYIRSVPLREEDVFTQLVESVKERFLSLDEPNPFYLDVLVNNDSHTDSQLRQTTEQLAHHNPRMSRCKIQTVMVAKTNRLVPHLAKIRYCGEALMPVSVFHEAS